MIKRLEVVTLNTILQKTDFQIIENENDIKVICHCSTSQLITEFFLEANCMSYKFDPISSAFTISGRKTYEITPEFQNTDDLKNAFESENEPELLDQEIY